MDKQPSQHTPASIARNIGIGVITPVLAATIIYFLGFNRNDNAEFKKKKAATIEAWNAFEQNKEVYSKVFKAASNVTDIEVTRKNVNYQIDATVDNMNSIKKDGNADQRLYSTIDLTVKQILDMKPLINKYFDDILAFSAQNVTETEGQAFINKIVPQFKADLDQIKQRDSIRLAVFYEGLNKDYGITHSGK